MLSFSSKDDLIYQDELNAIDSFDSEIIAYRGTDNNETVPDISWSLRRNVAESLPFNKGRVFKAIIPKENVLLCFMHSEDEQDIIADVASNYEIIYDEKESPAP